MEKPSPSHNPGEHVEQDNPHSYTNLSHSAYILCQSRRNIETTNDPTHNDIAKATSILSLHNRKTEEGAVQEAPLVPTSSSSKNLASHENASVELLPHSLGVDPVSSSQPQYAVTNSTEPFPDYDEGCEISPVAFDRVCEEAYIYALSQELPYGRQREAEYLHFLQREVGAAGPGDPPESPTSCPDQSTASTNLVTEANLCAHLETTSSCETAKASTHEQVSRPVEDPPIPAAATGGSPVAPPSIPVTRSSSLGSPAEPESTPDADLVVSPAESQNGVDLVLGGDIPPEPGCEDGLSPESGSQDQESTQRDSVLESDTSREPGYEIQVDSALGNDTSPEPEYLSNTDIMSYTPIPGADDECQSLLEEMRRLLQSPQVLYRHSKLYSQMSTDVLTVSHICLRRYMMDPRPDYDAFLRPADIHSLRPSLARLTQLAEQLSAMLRLELDNVNDLVRKVGYQSKEENVAPIRRYVNVADTIIRKFYVVQPTELQIFKVFYNFFFAWLYDDFRTFRMPQKPAGTVSDPDRIAVTSTVMNICGILNGAWDYYHTLAASDDRIGRDVLVPMTNNMPNGSRVWNSIFDQSKRMLGGRRAPDEFELSRRQQKLQARNV